MRISRRREVRMGYRGPQTVRLHVRKLPTNDSPVSSSEIPGTGPFAGDAEGSGIFKLKFGWEEDGVAFIWTKRRCNSPDGVQGTSRFRRCERSALCAWLRIAELCLEYSRRMALQQLIAVVCIESSSFEGTLHEWWVWTTVCAKTNTSVGGGIARFTLDLIITR